MVQRSRTSRSFEQGRASMSFAFCTISTSTVMPLLLIGGDKKGKNEKEFYKSMIQIAETLIEQYRQ